MIGKRISGRYKLLEVIGDGGMAIVYRAVDLILDRDVAVKILRTEFSDDEEFIRRFRREAEAATSLDHPNIVSIFDVGEEDNIYFIVMEYVQGKTLKQYIKEHDRLSVEQSIDIIRQIASGMAVAHDHGIIHRDIKPHNILLNSHGTAKVTDFGIALAITSATITHTNSVLGSVHYFSPEQARGGLATGKSDIYSLGIVLYEMVTGRVPFTGESPVSVALKHLQDQVIEPRKLNPDIPQSVENIILRCLSKNPLFRYDTAHELLDDVAAALSPGRINEKKWTAFQDNEEEKTKMMDPVILDNKVPESKPAQKKNEKLPEKKKRKWWLILLILLVLGGGAAVAAFTVLPALFYVEEVSVPDVKNQEYEDALDRLTALGLEVSRKEQYDPEIEDGKVIRQNPVPGTKVKEGSKIVLTVSKGLEESEMPDITGLNIEEAENILESKGYINREIIYEVSDTEAEGYVISQSPETGENVIPSQVQVIIRVSSGPEVMTMDNLMGLTKDEVEAFAKDTGLKTIYENEYSDTVEKGKVISQDPPPYTELQKGDTVTVKLSDGPDPAKEEEEQTGSQPDVPESKQFKAKLTVKIPKKNNKEPVAVKIVYSDLNESGKVFAEETITETKDYEIPMTVAKGGTASYTLYINGKEETTKTYDYNDLDDDEGDQGD
jgi:serine/threonine-protein kinase